MALRRLAVLSSIFLISAPFLSVASEEPLQILVDSASEKSLSFRLINSGRTTIKIKNWQLPWTDQVPYPLALSIHVIDPQSGRVRPLEHAAVIASENATEIAIEPGESITGDVEIDERSYDSTQDRGSSILAIHWTYSLSICDLNKTFINIGVAQRHKAGIKILYQKTSYRDAPLACHS
jgi:hypothetical protein